MAAISRITIDGFKAFPDSFTLDLGTGNNLLLYGENGSGKSSIYYALYSLLQSQCKEKNDVYFDVNHQESLVNQHTQKADAKVEIQFEGSDVSYKISHRGYEESVHQAISPLRDLNGKCVFINHKFLFNVFAFRNSQCIDLFPVFIKDILPFTLTRDKSQYISGLYEEIMMGVERMRKRTTKSYSKKIQKFNNELLEVINKINTNNFPAVSKLYNDFFRNEGDPELQIKLIYDNNVTGNQPPQPGISYWLRLGHLYKQVVIANINRIDRMSHRLELLPPVITLEVKEKQDDGTFTIIKKPQTYFNEAKLTAIALAIRFSLLDTISPEDGRFLALDDMLISLDMSNRIKVVNFLISISDKYKIYLFTHDRAFFELTKEIILSKIDAAKDIWLFKELYNNENVLDNPVCLPSDDAYTRAIFHFKKFDYPATANYLRKAVEESMNVFPQYISINNDGSSKEKLRAKIDSAKNLLASTDGDINDINQIILSLGTLLNPLSHRSIDTNIYRTELENVIKIIPRLRQHVIDLEIKEVIAVENDVYLCVDEDATTICEIKITLKTPLYSYKGKDGQRYFSIANGNSVESVTIRGGVAEPPQQFTYFTNLTLEECCKRLFAKIGKVYANNYIDFYKNAQGADFNTLL